MDYIADYRDTVKTPEGEEGYVDSTVGEKCFVRICTEIEEYNRDELEVIDKHGTSTA
jgi:hypothetical protein